MMKQLFERVVHAVGVGIDGYREQPDWHRVHLIVPSTGRCAVCGKRDATDVEWCPARRMSRLSRVLLILFGKD